MQKLGVKNRTQVAVAAARAGCFPEGSLSFTSHSGNHSGGGFPRRRPASLLFFQHVGARRVAHHGYFSLPSFGAGTLSPADAR